MHRFRDLFSVGADGILQLSHDSFYVLSGTILVWFDPVFWWWLGRCSGCLAGPVYIEVASIFFSLQFLA